jgi:hypothetical protein
MKFRCARFLSTVKVLCALNDRVAKKAYLGTYVLNLEKGWRETTPRQLPARIHGVTGMEVCQTRRMVAIATNDMSVNVFHMDTFAVCPLCGGRVLMGRRC